MLVAGVCAVLGLSGCSPLDDGAARLKGDSLLIATCDPIEAGEIVVEVVSENGEYQESREIWRVEGQRELVPGETFVVGEVPEGMTEVVPFASGSLKSQSISISIFAVDATETMGNVLRFGFRGSELSDDAWLHNDARSTDAAC